MQVSNRAQMAVSTAVQFVQGKPLATWLLVFLGLGLAPAVAILISRGQWLYAIVVALVAPGVALFCARPFIGVILWLLLMPLSSALANAEVVYWALHRIMIPCILVLAVLSRALKVSKHPPVRLGPPELAMGILAGLVPSFILLFQTDNRLPLIQYVDRILIPFCMYLVMRLTDSRERDLRLLQWTVLFIATSQCVIGLLSWFAPQILPRAWISYWQGYRTSGSLANPNVYAVVLIFCATLLFHAAMNRKPDLVRALFLSVCGLSAVCVFLSLERAAWLGAVFAIAGLLVLYPGPMLRLISIGVVVMIVLGAGPLSNQMAAASGRIGQQQQIDDRVVVSDAMVQMTQIKPVFGWGYGTLNQNLQQYYQRVGDAAIAKGFVTSHNTYLTILVELGLVGFLLYLFPTVWWLVLTVRVWQRMPRAGLWSRSLLAVLWLATLSSFIVSNFMDMRFFPIGLTLWWMALGLIANLVQPYTGLRDKTASISVRQSGPAAQTPRHKSWLEKDPG
jgi:O-antigen ligase